MVNRLPIWIIVRYLYLNQKLDNLTEICYNTL
jgi:hypothetical protein